MGWDGVVGMGKGSCCVDRAGGGVRERMRGVVGDHWGNERVIYHLGCCLSSRRSIYSGAAVI